MKRGFTLVELMVTLLIILILLTLALSAYHQVVQAQSLAGAAQLVSAVLEEAHTAAQTQNRPVKVRFYQVTTEQSPLVLRAAGARGTSGWHEFRPGRTELSSPSDGFRYNGCAFTVTRS